MLKIRNDPIAVIGSLVFLFRISSFEFFSASCVDVERQATVQQGHGPIFLALGVADDDLLASDSSTRIPVPYSISTMSRSIPSNSASTWRTSSTANTTGKRSGRCARMAVDIAQFDAEHFAIQKKQGGEGLVLGGKLRKSATVFPCKQHAAQVGFVRVKNLWLPVPKAVKGVRWNRTQNSKNVLRNRWNW